MKTVRFKFEFRSFWSIHSGFGSGALLDSVVVRTEGGLPYLPGRSVKGLFRHAVGLGVAAGVFSREAALDLFGSEVDAEESARARTETEAGKLHFSNAVLSGWEAWAAGSDDSRPLIDEMFRSIAATKIGENGQAQSGSLRVNEVTIPLTLEASVDGPNGVDDTSQWESILELAAGVIREAGAGRNRGLGRVFVKKVG